MFWPAVAFLGVAGSLLLLTLLFGNADPRIAGRFEELANDGSREFVPPRRGWLRLAGPQLSEWAEVLVPNDAADRTRLQGRLFQAGIYSPAALSAFLAAKLIAMIAAPVCFFAAGWLGLLPFSNALLMGSLLGLTGSLLPGWWLARRRAKRHLVLRRSAARYRISST
jgi:hypothetical protein